MYYVIDLHKGYTVHQDSANAAGWERCNDYIRNSQDLFGAGPFVIAASARERDNIIKNRCGSENTAGRLWWEAMTED